MVFIAKHTNRGIHFWWIFPLPSHRSWELWKKLWKQCGCVWKSPPRLGLPSPGATPTLISFFRLIILFVFLLLFFFLPLFLLLLLFLFRFLFSFFSDSYWIPRGYQKIRWYRREEARTPYTSTPIIARLASRSSIRSRYSGGTTVGFSFFSQRFSMFSLLVSHLR